MTTLSSITSAALREAANIQDQIEALGKRLMDILTGAQPKSATAGKASAPGKGRKKMSAAARAKIAAAQKARWAKVKGNTTATAAAPTTKGKKKFSPAHRAKLAASMKARWDAKKAASKK